MQPTPQPPTGFIFSEAMYNKLKYVAMILLPAFTAFYAVLGNIWDWPNVEEVLASLAGADALLGVLLGISTKSYNASDARFVGDIVVVEAEDGGKVYSLEFNGDPEAEIDGKSEVTFKVGR